MQSAPSGVKIFVFNPETPEPLTVDKDGYLGTVESMGLSKRKPKKIMGSDGETLENWESLQFEVMAEPGVQIYGFNVDANKDVTACRNWRAKPEDEDDPALDAPEGAKVYRRFVPVIESELRTGTDYQVPQQQPQVVGSARRWILPAVEDCYCFPAWGVLPHRGKGSRTVPLLPQWSRRWCCPAHVENEKQKGWPRLLTLLNTVLIGEAFQSLPPIKEADRPHQADERPQLAQNQRHRGWRSARGVLRGCRRVGHAPHQGRCRAHSLGKCGSPRHSPRFPQAR